MQDRRQTDHAWNQMHPPVSMVAWYIILQSQPSDTGSDDCLQDIVTECTL